jgi:hypothetical protein
MAGPNYVLSKGFVAGGAIRKFRCVEISATTEVVTECNAANDHVLGICQDEISAGDATNGRVATVALLGIARAIAGGAINPTTNGGLVTTDNQGRVVAAPVAVGAGYPVVGKALQSAVAGDHIDVLLTPGAVFNTAVS